MRAISHCSPPPANTFVLMTLTSLELAGAGRVQRVARIQGLSEEMLRRHAVRAANGRDADALWELIEAHLALRGSSGIATSRHTMRAYRRGLDELLLMWQGENLLRPGRDAGTLYVQRLLAGDRQELLAHDPPRAKRGRRVKDGPLSRATVSLRVAAGRALYDALAWSGATDADPFRDVRLGRTGSRLDNASTSHVYTERELVELLAVTKDEQDALIVLLGSHAGLRVSEMLNLEWSAVDLANGELLVLGGKGGKTAAVLLSPRLAAVLSSCKSRTSSASEEQMRTPMTTHVLRLRSQYGVYNRLRGLCNRAGVDFKGVHALRHAAGTKLYSQTGDLGQVQDHLRHATLDMARRYARSDRRRLRGSLEDWE